MKTFQGPQFNAVMKQSRTKMDVLCNHFRKTKCHSKVEVSTTIAPFWSEHFSLDLPENARKRIVEICRFKDMPKKPQRMVNLDRSRSEETFQNCDEIIKPEEFIIDDSDSD